MGKVNKLKQFIIYAIKWQLGGIIMSPVVSYLPIENVNIKVIIGNFIGSLIFYPIDMWIFSRDKKGKV